MALFGKKLYMKNTAGTQQSANIYSTTGETGSPYMYATVDGTQGYVRLVSTSNAFATSGRVIKSGTTYAIGRVGTVSYGYGVYWSSGTFTVPSNVYRLRVTCVGGGAGGGTDYSLRELNYKYGPSSNGTYSYSRTWTVAGGTTTFSSVSAAGGSNISYGGTVTYSKVTSGEDTTVTRTENLQYFNVSTGYNNGTYLWHTSSYIGGAAATPVYDINGTQITSAGAGGNGDGDGFGYGEVAANGASGKRVTGYINVSPGQQIGYTVGGGGYGWWRGGQHTGGSSGGSGCGMGSGGCILVEWGGSIQ